MKSHHNCLLCFTPPYILERIIETGSAKQKVRALKVLTLSGQMRGRRQSLTRVKFPFPRTLLPGKQRYVYSAGYGFRPSRVQLSGVKRIRLQEILPLTRPLTGQE